jgi:hypothetical protein
MLFLRGFTDVNKLAGGRKGFCHSGDLGIVVHNSYYDMNSTLTLNAVGRICSEADRK